MPSPEIDTLVGKWAERARLKAEKKVFEGADDMSLGFESLGTEDTTAVDSEEEEEDFVEKAVDLAEHVQSYSGEACWEEWVEQQLGIDIEEVDHIVLDPAIIPKGAPPKPDWIVLDKSQLLEKETDLVVVRQLRGACGVGRLSLSTTVVDT